MVEAIHRDVTLEPTQYPEERNEKGIDRNSAPAIRSHMKNLLSCIASRGRPVADIEEGHISSASCILANLSMKTGRTLAWDSAAGKIIGDDEANQLLRRPYRAPWVHPEPGNV
jgi:hypothetical protein